MELDKGKPYDFAVVVYEGTNTADRAFDALRDLEKEGALKLHDAAAGCSAAYGASKGAVSALTRGLAVEFGGKGVRVNAIVPGETATPMIAAPKLPEDPDFSIMGRMAPLDGQTGTPDQIAGAIAMLASDDGSYINGAEVRADGGGLT